MEGEAKLRFQLIEQIYDRDPYIYHSLHHFRSLHAIVERQKQIAELLSESLDGQILSTLKLESALLREKERLFSRDCPTEIPEVLFHNVFRVILQADKVLNNSTDRRKRMNARRAQIINLLHLVYFHKSVDALKAILSTK